jgi:two-component system, cell cycle sensor histidine kinase and response regulator CckA
MLISDVVMPEMGGPELAEAFALVRPGVPVILMSGYSDRMLRKDVTAKLVQKLFTPTELLLQIRTTLSQE